MKSIATILITMSLFLAFKPGIQALVMPGDSTSSCCIDICSSEEHEIHGEHGEHEAHTEDTPGDCHDDDCGSNFCNPFQSCGSCVFYSLSKGSESFVPNTPFKQKKFSYQLNVSSNFIIEFWHPPEMA